MNYLPRLLIAPLIFVLGCSSATLAPKSIELERLWVRDPLTKPQLGYRRLHQMQPFIYKELIIHGNALEGLVAYDRASAHEVWRRSFKNGVEMSADLSGDTLYVASDDGNFYSLNAATGETLWTFNLKSEGLGAPTIADGKIFVMSGNHTVYALEAESGKMLWSYKRLEISSLSIRGNSKPLILRGQVFIGFPDGYLVNLKSDSGTLIWELFLNDNKRFRDVDSGIVAAGDRLYVSGFDKALYAVDAKSGQSVWQLDEGGYSTVLLDQDFIYYSTTGSRVHCLSRETGKKIWTYKVPDGIATQPVLHRGMLIFGESQGPLTVLDARTGIKLTSYYPGRGVFAVPQVDEKTSRIFFTSVEGYIYSLQLAWKSRAFQWAWE